MRPLLLAFLLPAACLNPNTDLSTTDTASSTPNVFTNTLPDGTSASEFDCTDWAPKDNKNTTTVGDSSAFDSTWSNLGPDQRCSNTLRLYCFQDL